MQVQVCIHLCYILGPILLSSLLRLFNVVGLIWRLLHMIPYCLNRHHHGLTKSVRNLDRQCTLHQIIQWWSQSLIYFLRFNWKLFFGVSGLHLASSLLILYHELVIVQCILFWRVLICIVCKPTSLEHYLMASTFVLYYITYWPSLLYPPTFWLVAFCRYLTPPASVIHYNSSIVYCPLFHNLKIRQI